MLVRCPHCDHRIKVRNARPRTYELVCPRCRREFYLLIEHESGPDQLATVFNNFDQMKEMILQARARRTSSQTPTIEPDSRPETPEVIQGLSATSPNVQDDEDDESARPDRPDVPISLVGLNVENSQGSPSEKAEHLTDSAMALQVLPHVVPSALSEDDQDHQPVDLLADIQLQFDEEQMGLESNQEESYDLPPAISRPDSPRVTEVENYIHPQRPEFTNVDEMIPTFQTGVDEQDRHPDFSETTQSLVTDVDDVQAALPSNLLNLDEDEDEAPKLPEPVSPQKPPPKAKGWWRWFKKR